MIEDNLEVPFKITVLGVTVTVQKVTQTEAGIVADCVRDGHHQAISVLDLPLPEPPPKGAQWIASRRKRTGGAPGGRRPGRRRPCRQASRVPEQLIRWEADYGWTRRGYGQVAEKETPLAVSLARLLATPDMWRTFAESYLEAASSAMSCSRGVRCQAAMAACCSRCLVSC